MFNLIKRIFVCNHIFEKTKTCRSERKNNDNLVIEETLYRCVNCDKQFIVRDIIKVEKDYYI